MNKSLVKETKRMFHVACALTVSLKMITDPQRNTKYLRIIYMNIYNMAQGGPHCSMIIKHKMWQIIFIYLSLSDSLSCSHYSVEIKHDK